MKKVGYNFLIEAFSLLVPPLTMHLYQGDGADDEVREHGQYKVKILAKKRATAPGVFENISTAIKYEGIRLVYLYPLFHKIDKEELSEYINKRPNAEIRRAIWYLFEWLTGQQLGVPDSKARYMNLLDDRYYFTLPSGVKDQRTRVINNCIGNKEFCPIIRKTRALQKWSKVDMIQIKQESLQKLSKHLNTEILGRSVTYLYTKETKSSTEIEKEDGALNKTQKFFRVLKTSGIIGLSKQRLLFVQNQIVRDAAKKDSDYRSQEIYVGETRHTKHGPEENIHYIGPSFNEVPALMKGLLRMHEQLMLDGSLPPMIHAAILSFGLVYIHPFSDGNGRIHRYLIHDVLKARTPSSDDLIIPVSAAILNNTKAYDTVLEIISKPIMAMLDFDVKEENSIVINNSLSYLYRYPDFTEHVIFLYKMMKEALNVDLLQEIIFILKFDKIKKEINSRYDIVNKELDLLVTLLLQNNGKPSKKVKKRYSDILGENGLCFVSETSETTIKFFDSLMLEVDQGAENEQNK